MGFLYKNRTKLKIVKSCVLTILARSDVCKCRYHGGSQASLGLQKPKDSGPCQDHQAIGIHELSKATKNRTLLKELQQKIIEGAEELRSAYFDGFRKEVEQNDRPFCRSDRFL